MSIQAQNFIISSENDIPQPGANMRQEGKLGTLMNAQGFWVPQTHFVIVPDIQRAIAKDRKFLFTTSISPCVAVYIWITYGDKNLMALGHFDSGSVDGSPNMEVEKVFPALVDMCRNLIIRTGATPGQMYVQSIYGATPDQSSEFIRAAVRDSALRRGMNIALRNVWDNPTTNVKKHGGIRACTNTAITCSFASGKHYVIDEWKTNTSEEQNYASHVLANQSALIHFGRLDNLLSSVGSF